MTPSTERFAAAAHAARLTMPGRDVFGPFSLSIPYERVARFIESQAGLEFPLAAPGGWNRRK